MPIYVLRVACNDILRQTAARLAAPAHHRVIRVPDLDAALETLTGIRFDVLVTGAIPLDSAFARFLGAARLLQPGLHVVGSRKRRKRPAPVPALLAP
jgi:hypothetical protein